MKKYKISKYLQGDIIIWTIVFVLFLISILTVYSSTVSLAYRSGDINAFRFLLKHFGQIILGLIIIFVVHRLPYRLFRGFTEIFLLIGVALLIYTLFSGSNINQASRWISIPGIGITFQTSEYAKITLLMYVAKQLHKREHVIHDFKKGVLPILIPIIFVCGLIVTENLSTGVLLAVICFILMFIGRVKIMHLILVSCAGAIIGITIITFVIAYSPQTGRIATWRHRIERFVSAENVENVKQHQIIQSKIAIATGGIFGKGPGKSTQKYFLPHAYSDFIYSIICEEYGLFGGLLLLALYLILLYRLGVLINISTIQYPAYLATGIILMFVFQAIIHMLVALDLFPVTGQTLPLVSWGGSSILINSVGIGMVLSVSKTLIKQKDLEQQGREYTLETDDN